MPRIGFDSSGTTPYVYIETESGTGPTISSTAIGMDATSIQPDQSLANLFKIATGPFANITPETLTPNLSIDPSTNGDFTIRANGTGDINLISANITTTGGILNADVTTGRLTISGAVATTYDADSGSATPSGNTITIAGGSGISTSAAGSTITIAATGGGGIATLDGNSGSATGATVTIATAHSTPTFVGSGATVSLDFAVPNFGLGSSFPALAGGTLNTAAGYQSLDSVTSGSNNTAFGYQALNSLTTGTSSTAIGQSALASLTTNNENTCVGTRAGAALDASFNTIMGYNSGSSMTTGQSNTIVGHDSTTSLLSGLDNLILGVDTGNNYTGSESFNILLGASGVIADSRTLRIGDGTGGGTKQLQQAFISGIDGVDLSTATLVTESSDQLGTTVLTAGTNITITPGAGTLTIDAAGGGGITTLDGNSGSATGATVTITTGAANANGTALFTGSGATITQTFSDANNNTGLGLNCLAVIGAGANNTAFGWNSCPVATGDGLCFMGSQSGNGLTTGHHNASFGDAGFFNLITGAWNAGLGTGAGNNYTGAESHNISINSRTTTVTGENNTLRIGDGTGSGTQQLAQSFISGIQGVVVTGTAVLVSASDQLGVAASSARFKQDVLPMAADSSPIYDLKPVTFAWNKQSSPGLKDAANDRQFGLIAEQVAQTMPHLVNNDKDGKPFSVHYERLIPMLLNEIQRLEKRVAALERK